MLYVCMYGHDRSSCVSMKNQLDALPFFLNYGAPRGSSAITRALIGREACVTRAHTRTDDVTTSNVRSD